MVGREKQLRIGEMGDAEWATIVEGLKREGRWDEMRRILFLAPVEWAAEMVLASGSKDKTVRLWRLAWAKPLTFAGYGDLEYVQGVLRERKLSESERRGWQFLEALLKQAHPD